MPQATLPPGWTPSRFNFRIYQTSQPVLRSKKTYFTFQRNRLVIRPNEQVTFQRKQQSQTTASVGLKSLNLRSNSSTLHFVRRSNNSVNTLKPIELVSPPEVLIISFSKNLSNLIIFNLSQVFDQTGL
ncbi:MAG: hypothetical protein ACTS46_01055 [Candidatus Hodgkinia cicadicola]